MLSTNSSFISTKVSLRIFSTNLAGTGVSAGDKTSAVALDGAGAANELGRGFASRDEIGDWPPATDAPEGMVLVPATGREQRN